ncbi:methylated-DNA--protein-cysteine methyltransferase [Cellulomonas gelida]|uniref:Methylated-DNA--protein-cysteine methyltransferase n=1 Tax=Cellulomonas gelida TaxID=1712 RepID=A0A4Y3KLQ3_9CELL|nr:methylated-DNA--protein-cysteine methyltransferase [Cellulomonas gelida]GGL18906.1 methylated-DNA--protein-cysteine methyltransferase [Cellulomonas gelida]
MSDPRRILDDEEGDVTTLSAQHQTEHQSSGRLHTVLTTPIGPVAVAVADGAVTHVRMTRSDDASPDPFGDAPGTRVLPDDDPVLAEAARQLTAYFAGTLRAFDLPLRPSGSAFQLLVWAGLRRIPYGTTTTYGALAADLGLDPRTSSRAVGAANGANRIAIVVPCHRVIGADGTLTGFAAGVDRKRSLLDLEQGDSTRTGRLF